MPWKAKRLLYLMGCGFGALFLAITVIIRDSTLDTELLGWLGVLGGIAIIITNLPVNGDKQT